MKYIALIFLLVSELVYARFAPPPQFINADTCAYSGIKSSDGELKAVWGPEGKSVNKLALAFCKKGEVIAEYKILDLVDDEEKIKELLYNYEWKAAYKLDELTNSLYLRTQDDNEYVFDMHTGKIVEYHHDQIPTTYQAEIIFKEGESKVIKDIRNCGHHIPDELIKNNVGSLNEITVEPLTENSNDTEIGPTVVIRFFEIKRITLLKYSDTFRSIWRIDFVNEKSPPLTVRLVKAILCGIDEKGKSSILDYFRGKEITFNGSEAILAHQNGKRSIAQRMQWNKFESESAKNNFCNAENPYKIIHRQYIKLDEVYQILKEIRWAKCDINSRKIVTTIADLQSWIRNTLDRQNKADVLRELARFQNNIGQYRDALVTYEQLIAWYSAIYENRPEGTKYFLQYKRSVVKEMLRASIQAKDNENIEKFNKMMSRIETDRVKLQ